MKKIFAFSLIFLLFTVAASAQRGPGRGQRMNHHRQITRAEGFDLRRDAYRLGMTEHRAHRDGFVSPRERMQIGREKRGLHREAYRYRHNRRHRVI